MPGSEQDSIRVVGGLAVHESVLQARSSRLGYVMRCLLAMLTGPCLRDVAINARIRKISEHFFVHHW